MGEGAGDDRGSPTSVKPGALTALLQEVAATPERPEPGLASLSPGTVIGRFEVLRELGRGGFGVVYEARDRELGRQVALKVVRPGRVTEDEGKVVREAEAIARLTHPNLITLYDVGRSESGPYLVFEFLRGQTLQERLDDGPMPVQEAVHLAMEVARGLAHAHAEGVVHRDLKPSNVFVTNKGQVKILDFGMAHVFGRRRVSGGTPAYMAPEQWEDDPEDERTDVFALGVMLYRMLSGEYPFREGRGRWSAAPATARRLDVPGAPELAELVDRMLDRTPRGRPRDGATVLAALTPIEERLRARPADGSQPVHATRRKAKFADLLAELKRRHVFRVMIGYGIFAFAVLQVTEPIMHGAHLPDWVLTVVLTGLALGFPVAVVLAWLFDLTAQGVRRTPSASGPGAPWFGRARLVLPLAVAAAVLAIATAGAGAWHAWKRAREHRPAPSAAAAAPSVAVLPFADMSPEHDQEYFADGVAEEIRNALAHVDGLKVIGRTSSFSFKGKTDDLKTIGQKLGVANVLEGSLRRDGNGIRITAQLIRVADGSHLWSESFDRKLPRIFEVQDEIARAVVGALKVKLLPGKGAGQGAARAASAEAYRLYLLSRSLQDQGTREAHLRSIDPLERALQIDPGFALAHVWLAVALGNLADMSSPEGRRMYLRAGEEVERAIELDPREASAYALRASRRMLDWDWESAQRDLDQAMALNSSDVLVQTCQAFLLTTLGRNDEAVAAGRRAVEIDPLSAILAVNLAGSLRRAGRLDEAREMVKRALEISPGFDGAVEERAVLDLMEGQAEAALSGFERLQGPYRLRGVAVASHALGRGRESLAALSELERVNGDERFLIAGVHAYRGDRDGALQWLEQAHGRHDPDMAWVKASWALSSLRDDPGYAALLRKMNLPTD